MSDNMSESKHIASLDFDISNIPAQLEKIEQMLKSKVPTLEALSKVNWKIDDALAQERLKMKAQLDKIELDLKGLVGKSKGIKIDFDTKTALNDVEKLKQELKELQSQAKATQATPSSANPNNTYSNAGALVKRFAEFKGLNLVQQFGSNAVKSVVGVESKMSEMARIMSDNTVDIKNFRNEIFQLGQEYGRSFEDTSEVALRFAQAGYSVAETLKMTKASLLALNTAELDVTNSTNSMVGIMAQWKLNPDELTGVIDKINYTADKTATTAQDLVDGLLTASSVAKTANMSFNDTVGVLTAMKEASGRSGKEVGNAFKSILSYIQRDKSLKAFDDMGISVFKDKVTGELLPMMTILQNMSDKWNNSSDAMKDTFVKSADMAELFNEQIAIDTGTVDEYNQTMEQMAIANDKANDSETRAQANQSAGVYRRNYYIALMENFNKALTVSADLQNASGYSAQENGKRMETLDAKYQSLIVSLKQLAVESADNGFMDLAKGAVETATAFNNLLRGVGGLQPALGTLLGLIMIIKREKIAMGIEGIVQSFATLVPNIKNTASALTTGTSAMKGFGAATSAMLGWIGLLITAVNLVSMGIGAYNASQEEARQKAIDTATANAEQTKTLNELINKHKELADIKDKTPEVEQQIADNLTKIKDIGEQLPDIEQARLDLLDKQNTSLEEQKSIIDEISKAQNERNLNDMQSAYNQAKEKFNKPTGANKSNFLGIPIGTYDIAGAPEQGNAMQALGGDIYNKMQPLVNYSSVAGGFSIIGDTALKKAENAKKILDMLRSAGKQESDLYNDVTKAYNNYNAQATDFANTTKQLNVALVNQAISSETMKSKTVDSVKSYQDYKQALITATMSQKGFTGTTEDATTAVDSFMQSKYPDYIGGVSNELKKLASATEENYEATKQQAILNETQYIDGLAKQILGYANLTTGIKDASTATAKYGEIMARVKVLQSMPVVPADFIGPLPSGSYRQSDINAEVKKLTNLANEVQGLGTLYGKTFQPTGGSKPPEDALQKATDAINEQVTAFEHLSSMGRKTIGEQISFYRNLLNTASYTADMRMQFENKLFELYKKQVQDKLKLIEEEKNAKIKAINEQADKEIQALQDTKDQTAKNREEEDYQEQRAKLERTKKYWEMRSGREALENARQAQEDIAALDKEWARTQEDNATDEKIRGIETRRDSEVSALEQQWDIVNQKFTEENINLIASAGVAGQQYFDNFFKTFDAQYSSVSEKLSAIGGVSIPPANLPSSNDNPPSNAPNSGGGGGLAVGDRVKATSSGNSKSNGGGSSASANNKGYIDKVFANAQYPYRMVKTKGGQDWLGFYKANSLQEYAKGTLNSTNGLRLVGEQGAELEVGRGGTGIIPAKQTQNLLDLANNAPRYEITPLLIKDLVNAVKDVTNIVNNNSKTVINEYKTEIQQNYNNNIEKVEDMADVQIIANAVGRQVIKSMSNLPKL